MRKRIYAWFMTLVLSITSISSTSIIYADDFSDETEVMTEDEGTEEEYITDDSEIDFDSEEDASINEEQIEEDESEESQDEVTIEQEISEEEEAEGFSDEEPEDGSHQVDIVQGNEFNIELDHEDGRYQTGETVNFSGDIPQGSLIAVGTSLVEANQTENTEDFSVCRSKLR
mgnify:CR=1 FL=1